MTRKNTAQFVYTLVSAFWFWVMAFLLFGNFPISMCVFCCGCFPDYWSFKKHTSFLNFPTLLTYFEVPWEITLGFVFGTWLCVSFVTICVFKQGLDTIGLMQSTSRMASSDCMLDLMLTRDETCKQYATVRFHRSDYEFACRQGTARFQATACCSIKYERRNRNSSKHANLL